MDLNKFPYIKAYRPAGDWMQMNANLGLAGNTLVAYARGLESFLAFQGRSPGQSPKIGRVDIGYYVRMLLDKPRPNRAIGLSNATIQQRLTAIRLFFEFLVDEGICDRNPIGRGRYTLASAGARRGLVPRYRELPWIPSDEDWKTVVWSMSAEPVRNRLMFLFGYDCALRREELCSIRVEDLDPALRRLRIRAENTKNRFARVLPYSRETGLLLQQYLEERRQLTSQRGSLFVSDSNRNRAQPLSIWSWSKIVLRVARHAGVSKFTTHTLRHLCLTDLARAGWELHDIAQFAGHRSIESTLRYIHLSGRELAAKLTSAMSSIRGLRISQAVSVQ